ncbi:WD40/YVTN/BNR-like repeat-containing protein [Ferrimonas senticii]|uniref:WD40/YVTN/BNR-like repeat-containing protein n=1 Tax=Ferrimonas senticii TaxID=394566 RepID=UPI000408E030|nr:YCF48-related protein [Ferrimonas senticii]
MQKIINTILLSGLCISAVNADTTSLVAPKAINSPVLDMAFNGTKMVAVGDRGHLLAYLDNQWQQLTVPSTAMLTAVSFHGKSGWAVGHDATILTTKDGGFSWRLAQAMPELDKPLLDVISVTPTTVMAVGAYGLAFRSNNGGISWQQQYFEELLHPDDLDYLNELKLEDEALYLDERSAMLPHFNRVSKLADDSLVMVGEMGTIVQSSDGGQSWQHLEPFYDGSLFDFLETKDGTWLATGLRGNVFRSTDRGQYWDEVDSTVETTINSLMQLDNGEIVMVANGGYVMVSNDDGQTFRSQLFAKGEDLVSVAQQQDGKVVISGSAGVRWIN